MHCSHRLEAKSILRYRAAAARMKSPAVWSDSLDPILKVRCSLYTGVRRMHMAPNSQWPPESQVHWLKPHPRVRTAIHSGKDLSSHDIRSSEKVW